MIAKCHERSEIEKELANRVSVSSHQLFLGKLAKEISTVQSDIESKTLILNKKKGLLAEAQSMGFFARTLKKIPSPEQLTDEINRINNSLSVLNNELQNKTIEYGRQQHESRRTSELQNRLKLLNFSPKTVEKQNSDVLSKIEKCREKIKIFDENIHEFNEKINEVETAMQKIKADFPEDIERIAFRYSDLKELIEKYVKQKDSLTETTTSKRIFIENFFDQVKTLCNIEFLGADPRDLIESLDRYTKRLANELLNFNLKETKENLNALNCMVTSLLSEIDELNNALAVIEREIILKAKVICTTLTKAYLSDTIQERRFDTVILDEASMASIPALWAATLMSDNNVVIVGDFRQLPPIVLSNNALAKKWIGSDIFERSGVKEQYDQKCAPEYFIPLYMQYRMHPDIADVANRYYGGVLETPIYNNRSQESLEFNNWYYNQFEEKSPIILVNTEGLNAWVTSVSKGSQSSRLNFLSATLSVNIAEQMLSKFLLDNVTKDNKILIISPYRPHAKLVDLLIKDTHSIEDIVRSGTVHSFQGSEADVVILDLVVDEPHFRVNLFINTPEIREQMRRLFNVSITRAKFKLIIIGDFKYCLSKGKNSELGDLLRFLLDDRKFPVIDAVNLVPNLHDKSLKAQDIAIGGVLESTTERLIVTQELFYKYLFSDLKSAKYEITIYSPFITSSRLAYILPQLQAAVERGVMVYIITKTLQERNENELPVYRDLEKTLSIVGANVIHKLRMHEKLVFIDENIVWTGSLNPLSFSSTQEIMERRQNREVHKHYRDALRLTELIECVGKPESKCPICSSEMIAVEGSNEPYFWKCINDDDCRFTRGIDQRYPMNGELTCANCGSTVEFAYRKEKPCWRCTNDKRHHQKLYKSHLKLPKMKKKIPKVELTKVIKYLDATYPPKKEQKNKLNKSCEQPTLFQG